MPASLLACELLSRLLDVGYQLLLLGLADRIAASYDSVGRLRNPAREPTVRSLGDALRRYGTSSDVQLWSCTDLAVQFALSRLPRL